MYELNIIDKDINIDIKDTDKYIKYIEKLTNINWKIIPNYENYIISEYGNVINIRSKKIRKLYLDKDNYYQIVLCKNNIHKTFRINRLVYFVFINDKDIEDYSIHHKDGNKLNNHYSNLEKMDFSKHSKYHHNLEFEKYIKKYKEYYNLKYRKNLSVKEIAKKYNISTYAVFSGIQQYKIYLFNNKDINKYNNFNIKEKKDFYSNVILKEDKRRYLEKAEEIYNLKYRKNLSVKEIAKKLNISFSTVERMIKRYKIYLYLNKDFNKYISLSKKDKNKLYSKLYNNKLLKNQRKYLKECKKIYNLKYKDYISIEKIANRLNISFSTVKRMIKRYKIYLYLNKDFDKYISLSRKDKNKLYNKILVERKDNVILDIGKMIKDLKLSGLSNKDIANKLNISIGKITYYYKRYKDLIKKI